MTTQTQIFRGKIPHVWIIPALLFVALEAVCWQLGFTYARGFQEGVNSLLSTFTGGGGSSFSRVPPYAIEPLRFAGALAFASVPAAVVVVAVLSAYLPRSRRIWLFSIIGTALAVSAAGFWVSALFSEYMLKRAMAEFPTLPNMVSRWDSVAVVHRWLMGWSATFCILAFAFHLRKGPAR